MTDQELNNLFAKFATENASGFAALREAQAKTEIEQKETARVVRELTNTLDGIGKSQGMVAEEFFYNSLSANPTVAGIHYDSVTSGLKRNKKGKATEIDILLENGTSVALTEVKYRVRTRDIEQVQRTLSTFRELFPQYRDYKVYAGIAGFSFDDEVVNQAHEQGLFVLKRKGDVFEVDSGSMRAF